MQHSRFALAAGLRLGLSLVLLADLASWSQHGVHFANAAALAPIALYVSPSGSDATGDGTFAHPFATLVRVQTEIRARKAAATGGVHPPIDVFLRSGRYELDATLEFSPDDTGASAQATITYQAYCDASVEAAMQSVVPYPYTSRLPTPPRLLWNGLGDVTAWGGPFDSFYAMGINRTSNSLLSTPVLPAPSPSLDIGDVCVDKVGVGHTCYVGTVATCVSGCMTACAQHLERKTYSSSFYREFTHLFGKELEKEEDCVEICSRSCRGCEAVTLSGAKRIPPGAIATWTLFNTITVTDASGTTHARKIFTADLAPFLPPRTEDAADNPTVFSTLFVDQVQYPRAGFPDCAVASGDLSATLTEFACTYSTPHVSSSLSMLRFDPAAFSTRVSQWSSVSYAEIELLPDHAKALNLRYRVARVDSVTHDITLGAGGSQLSAEEFTRGLDLRTADTAARARFRIENVLEELDAPGEWYFDPTTRLLYIIPLDSATATVTTMQALELEIPLLRQLVRVSGSRENQYTSATHASSTIVETDSTLRANNLHFRHLTFSSTQLLSTDVYERIPGAARWPMARVGAIFMESVGNIVIEHCTFERIGGNAIVVAGESDGVRFANNNISYVGSSAIALLARLGDHRNSYQAPVGGHLLFSRFATISFNQIHHFGRRVAHSAAIMLVGATQTTVESNLIFAFPTSAATNYFVANADGAAHDRATPLFRAIDAITIPTTLAQDLATAYTIVVPVSGFDFPVVAKLIGAPECPTGGGRVGSLYGEHTPYTYTQCSGCCSVHTNSAQIRVVGSSLAWADAGRSVLLRPGEAVELRAESSAFFNSISDVYVGFHVITPNQILELPTRAKWQIVTRKCRYADDTYTAECFGPCVSATHGCGNSNIAVQNSAALQCAPDYEPDVYSHVCTGPFEAMADCDNSGVLKSHLYYNCTISCFTTSCT